MPLFNASIDYRLSADCQSITLIDTTNYNTNENPHANNQGVYIDQFYNREMRLETVTGGRIGTKTLVNGELKATFPVAFLRQGIYLSRILIINGSSQNANVQQASVLNCAVSVDPGGDNPLH